MPELPEVETIRRGLEAHLQGKRLVSLEVYDRRLLSEAREDVIRQAAVGRVWERLERRGKYLVVHLSGGARLVFHLRMTGQLVLNEPSFENRKPRLKLLFDGPTSLFFYDQRRFGELFFIPSRGRLPSLERLGPDPLSELSAEAFTRLVKSKTTRIQPLLMDQHVLAGVGNIYSQEALFKAAIRPGRAGCRLTVVECRRLYAALCDTLQTAIERRGSTSRNYRDPLGQSGTAQLSHAVYRKGGRPCPQCGSILKAVRVGGRGSVYCSTCQH
jgi:formamidopyrimidine-DNA glycosylase